MKLVFALVSLLAIIAIITHIKPDPYTVITVAGLLGNIIYNIIQYFKEVINGSVS